MKNYRITYLIMLFLSLVFVYLKGGIVPWSIFYFMIVLPLLSLVNLYLTFRSLRFKEYTNKNTFIKGDSIKYMINLDINHFLPLCYINLYIKSPENYISQSTDQKEVFIASKKSLKFTYRIPCQYRGKYDMGILKMEFMDTLCLFKLTYHPLIKNTVTIYPRIKKVYESPVSSLDVSLKKQSYFNQAKGDESTVTIREYSYGDSSKLIHWKLSSKVDELLVRNKENILDSQVVLALDLKKAGFAPEKEIIYEDLLIEEIIASAHYFIKRNIPVDLVFNHNGLQAIHVDSIHTFNKLYTMLAEVPFGESSTIENILFDSLNNKEKISTIYVYCINLRHQVINKLITLRELGKQITAKYCFSSDNAYVYLEAKGITGETLHIAGERESVYYEK